MATIEFDILTIQDAEVIIDSNLAVEDSALASFAEPVNPAGTFGAALRLRKVV